jgi:hypothetical protein
MTTKSRYERMITRRVTTREPDEGVFLRSLVRYMAGRRFHPLVSLVMAHEDACGNQAGWCRHDGGALRGSL